MDQHWVWKHLSLTSAHTTNSKDSTPSPYDEHTALEVPLGEISPLSTASHSVATVHAEMATFARNRCEHHTLCHVHPAPSVTSPLQ